MWNKCQQVICQFIDKKSLIGLDGHANSVHALELDKTRKGKLQVRYYMQSALTSDGDDREDALIMALQKISASLAWKKKHIATALASNMVITKSIEIGTTLNAKEAEDFLTLNAEKYLGCGKEKIDMDYQIDAKNIKIIAVRKEKVVDHLALLKKANLFPQLIDIDIFALERSAKLLCKHNETTPAILNLDVNRLLLCILHKNKMLYSRAEYFSNQEPLSAQEREKAIFNNMQMAISACAIPINSLLLCGSQANQTDLIDYLEKTTELPLAIADPLQMMQFTDDVDADELKKNASELMICLGLALRKFDHDKF